MKRGYELRFFLRHTQPFLQRPIAGGAAGGLQPNDIIPDHIK
jgi:hypothetical protein